MSLLLALTAVVPDPPVVEAPQEVTYSAVETAKKQRFDKQTERIRRNNKELRSKPAAPVEIVQIVAKAENAQPTAQPFAVGDYLESIKQTSKTIDKAAQFAALEQLRVQLLVDQLEADQSEFDDEEAAAYLLMMA
jgi:hypothetical protein